MVDTWQAMSGASIETRLSIVLNNDLPLTSRAMATRSLCGLSPGQGVPILAKPTLYCFIRVFRQGRA
jgi:hypothetical protein